MTSEGDLLKCNTVGFTACLLVGSLPHRKILFTPVHSLRFSSSHPAQCSNPLHLASSCRLTLFPNASSHADFFYRRCLRFGIASQLSFFSASLLQTTSCKREGEGSYCTGNRSTGRHFRHFRPTQYIKHIRASKVDLVLVQFFNLGMGSRPLLHS